MPDFLDRLGDELMRAASAPSAQAAAPRLAPSPIRRLRGPGRGRRRWLLVALALLVAGAGAAAIATKGRPSPGPVPPRPGAALATMPDRADRAAFAILRRAPTAADQIPLPTPIALSGASGANLGQARRAAGSGGAQAWVVPGRGSVCLIAAWPAQHAGGAGCVPDATATAGELVLESASRLAPGREFIAGLVPDRVSSVTVTLAGGGQRTAPVRENVYLLAIAGSAEAVTFEGPHGTVRLDVRAAAIGPGSGHRPAG